MRSVVRAAWVVSACIAFAFSSAALASSCSEPTGALPGQDAPAGDAPEAGAQDVDTDVDTKDGPVDDGSVGGEPSWVEMPGSVAGCAVERLEKPAKVRAFTAKSCSGVPDCEELSYTPAFAGSVLAKGSMLRVVEGAVYVALLLLDESSSRLLLTRDDGWVLDGYRVPVAGKKCLVLGSSVWGDRFGFTVSSDPSDGPPKLGGILGGFGSANPPTTFETDPIPSGSGPSPTWLGEARWVWRFYAPKLVSVSATTGLDLVTFAPYDDSIITMGYPTTTTGSTFLFQRLRLINNGAGVESPILASDGVKEPEPYLIPPEDSYYLAPAYAGSHIAWFRGVSPSSVNKFSAVELWASPYSPNPAELSPYKVDDYGAVSAPLDYTAGFGLLATLSGSDAPVYGETSVWNLMTKERRTFTLPGGRSVFHYLGVAPAHVWVAGIDSESSKVDLLVRFTLK